MDRAANRFELFPNRRFHWSIRSATADAKKELSREFLSGLAFQYRLAQSKTSLKSSCEPFQHGHPRPNVRAKTAKSIGARSCKKQDARRSRGTPRIRLRLELSI